MNRCVNLWVVAALYVNIYTLPCCIQYIVFYLCCDFDVWYWY